MEGSDRKYEKPQTQSGDVAYTLAKAGLSSIPVIGGPAKELFSAIIAPPLSKRRDKWIESIATGLKTLEEKVDSFRIEDLSNNNMFVTTVMHASQAAIRNHQEEKLEALRNAVLNSALPNSIEEDYQLMFVDLIDTFTPWHLRILKFFDDPTTWGQKHGVSYPRWESGTPAHVLDRAFPELTDDRHFCNQIVKDLDIRGLMEGKDLHTDMNVSGMLTPRTTRIGKRFIAYITSPIEDEQ